MVVVEAPYVRDMIDHGEFDTIYHEHLCYFSLTALVGLFAAQGLTTVGVERLPTHADRCGSSRSGQKTSRWWAQVLTCC